MSAPGWYPDPAGAPDTLRYWDGSSWAETTMPAPPRSPFAPPAPGTDASAQGSDEQDDALDPDLTQPIGAVRDAFAKPDADRERSLEDEDEDGAEDEAEAEAEAPTAPTPTAPLPPLTPPGGAVGQPSPWAPGAASSTPPPPYQPYGTPPPPYGALGSTPSAPGPFGPSPFGPSPFGDPAQGTGPGKGRRRTSALVIAGAVVGLVALVGAGLVGLGALVADDAEVQGATASSAPAEGTLPDGSAPDDGESGSGPAIPGLPDDPACVAGILPGGGGGSGLGASARRAPTSYSAGGITMPAVPGYADAPQFAQGLPFATDAKVQSREVVPDKWVSQYSVGALSRDAFDDPQEATETVLQCLIDLGSFGTVEDRSDLGTEPITVDGADGWRLTSEITTSDDVGVDGDVVTVVVIDGEDDENLGLFLATVPIGDDELAARVDPTVQALTADPAP
ncbi:DUF2510 domain-containing protein [Nocardioides sp.]|uniref:DUF2510 domain-containing protein n=1 Tax=Nocardioides sp. TaxID=35761 RepID=UPI00351907A8